MAEDDESHVDSHESLSSSVVHNNLNVSSNHDEYITIEDDNTNKINNASIIISSDRNSFVKRYVTYDLNRSKNIDSTSTFSESAQAANFSSSSSSINHSLSKSTFEQHQTSDNKNTSSISKKPESSTKRLSPINTSDTITTNLDDIPQSPYGGIKVTTVVEVLNSPIKNEFENEVASSSTPKVNQCRTSTSSTKSKKRNSRPENIYTSVNNLLVGNGERKRGNISPPPPKPSTPSPPPPLPQSRSKQHIEFVSTKSNVKPNLYLQKQSPKKNSIYSNNTMIDDSRSQQKLKKKASMAPVKSLKIGNKRKGILDKQKEIIIPKEMAFIDPKLLTHGNLVRIPSNRRLKHNVNSNIHRKKIPKNMEYAPTSNPTYSNDPTDIDADLPQKNPAYPWLPEPCKPPQLLHASLVPLPHCSTSSSLISTVNNTLMMTSTSTEENNKNNINSNNNCNKNYNSKMLTIDQKHNSLLFTTSSANSKISRSNFLSRKNSLRKRTSLIQSSNRASLIFRRQLLEESIMMSFGGYNYMPSNNNNNNNNNNNANINIKQPSSLQKLPIRRKTKKGSNAKVEDRETRRERRRKEKEAKGLLNYISSINNTSSINYDSISLTKEEYHHTKKEQIFMGPQPPPRRSPVDNVMNGTQDYFQQPQPQQPKQKLNNTISLLLSSPIDRRNFNNSNDNDYNNNFIIGNSDHDKDMIMSTIEPTFPTHLLSSTPYFDNHSSTNKDRLKRLKSPYKTNQQQFLGKEEFDDELYSNNNKILSSTTNKPQKININILGGFFNKQNPKETSANQQQLLQNHHHQSISTSTQLPLSPLSPTTPLPTKSHFISQKTSPPQSPPLSPSKSSRLPTQLSRVGKQRYMNEVLQHSSNSEKIRKREQSEAGADTTRITNNHTANRLVGKIKTLKIDNDNNNNNSLSPTISSFSNSTTNSNDFNSLMNNNHERKNFIDMKIPSTTYIHKGHSCQDSYNGIIFGNRESINNSSDNYDRNSVDSADKISLVDRICSLQT